MAERIFLNENWMFSECFDDGMIVAQMTEEQGISVRLPHTVKELPYNYFGADLYQMVSCYQRMITYDPLWKGKNIRLTVEAAGHDAALYLNGELLLEHHCGYTAFTVDLTGKLKNGENLLTIRCDSRENLNIPPFGHVIDYMTYGGIYREVYLEISDPCRIEDVFPKVTVNEDGVRLDCDIYVSRACRRKNIHTRQSLWSSSGKLLAELPMDTGSYNLHNVSLWTPEEPNLYVLKTELIRGTDIVDVREDKIGFRQAEFRADGFFLNGKKYKIRGIDRHQSYPYVGYAMPASMQKQDAEILKHELGMNAVRTSHYPQSHHFLNACDELGLLVFTEIPGWQHLGDEAWKAQAIQNTQEMVLQYRNHPSIILWGVRVNESLDDDELYAKTNEVAHELDSTRQTSGVRYLQMSSLLEDVYAFNDFSYNGETNGCLPKAVVTPDLNKGYLISEYNGHMFPTKSFDGEDHRTEHMLRHATVVDSYYGHEDIAGGFGWCMFDYNTHKDFGSGDHICYHGIMDMFRNPKLAAKFYASQQDGSPVLAVSSSMDIGEHPGGLMRDVYAVTNADCVRLYRNEQFIREFDACDTPFRNLPHGPILIDDYIGNRIHDEENIPDALADSVKKILLAANKYGINSLPEEIIALAYQCQNEYGIQYQDLVEYYNKYVGNWGGQVTTYRFEAIKDGEVVKTIVKRPAQDVALHVEVSHTGLIEETTYDVASVRITALSDCGNLLNYYQEPVFLKTEGEIALIGPDVISLKGGMGGTYVKSTGNSGVGTLTISAAGCEDIVISFTVSAEGNASL